MGEVKNELETGTEKFDRLNQMEGFTTTDEAIIARSNSNIQFDFLVENVIPEEPQLRKLPSHVFKHGRRYTFPVFYLDSFPISLSLEVKVRGPLQTIAEQPMGHFMDANNVEEVVVPRGPRDLDKWCRVTIIYRFKRLGCACSAIKKSLDNHMWKSKNKKKKVFKHCRNCQPGQLTLESTIRAAGTEPGVSSVNLYNCNRQDKLYLPQRKTKQIGTRRAMASKLRFCNNYKVESDAAALDECKSQNSIIITTHANIAFINQRFPTVRNVSNLTVLHKDVMLKLLKSSTSFFVFKVEDEEIFCHKELLQAHSSAFEKLFSAKFSSTEDIRQNKFVVEDISKEGMKGLIEYMYTGDISHFAGDLKRTFEVLRAAHSYCMHNLVESCTRLLYFSNMELLLDLDTTCSLFFFCHQMLKLSNEDNRPFSSLIVAIKGLIAKCVGIFKLREVEVNKDEGMVQELKDRLEKNPSEMFAGYLLY